MDSAMVLRLALLGGALSLDTTAFLQIMASQPIVAASIAGWMVGDPVLGLAIGAVLQLIWVGVLPVGATPFPDTAAASVAAVGAASILSRGMPPGPWALATALLIALAAGVAGQRLIVWLRRVNIRFAERAIDGVRAGRTSAVGCAVAAALGVRFGAGVVLTGAALLLAAGASWAVPPDPGRMPLFVWAAPVAAASIAAAGRQRERFALVGGLVAGLALLLLA